MAIAASVVARAPGVEQVRRAPRRAAASASTRSAMSASRNATAWCSAIGRPNWTRSLAYCVAYSSAARARPVAAAESVTRERSKISIRPRKPSPSSPSRRSSATKQSGEEQLGVEDRALAHLAHRLPEREPLVVAVQQERRDAAVAGAAARRWRTRRRAAAMPPLEIHAFWPSRHVAAVDAARGRLDRGGVGAGVGLGRRERGHRRPLAGQRAHASAPSARRSRARAPARRRSRSR